LNPSLIERISSSILRITCCHDVATAIVWDYVGDNVLILTNYHTWNGSEYKHIFPPPPTNAKRKHNVKAEKSFTLSNENFRMSFPLSSDIFLCYDEDDDYAILKLPKDGFTMQRIPISLSVGICLKIHAFGYIGHTEVINVTPGNISSMVPYGFTMSFLSAPEYSGAAILSNGEGRAVGYMMCGNLDARESIHSQHQSYAHKFDKVIRATNRTHTPTSFPSGKSVRK
jgi:hypothetical protein